jgi:hypothetical protein
MKVLVPHYSVVQELHAQMSEMPLLNQLTCRTRFEIDIPYRLRCRPVLRTIPSSYPDPQDAIKATPEINKRDLQGTFQVLH